MIYTESTLFVRRAEAMTTDAGSDRMRLHQQSSRLWPSDATAAWWQQYLNLCLAMRCGIWITKHQILHQKHRKWWKCLCFYLLDVSIVNAYIVYKATAGVKSVSHLQFNTQLAHQEIRQTSGHVQCGDWGRVLLLSTLKKLQVARKQFRGPRKSWWLDVPEDVRGWT